MKVLSLKLKDDVFEEVEEITDRYDIPRNSYINSALEFYNTFNRRQLLKKKLAKESKLVRADSLRVLEEFEKLGDKFME